jgi:hypothetical protein
MVAFLIIAALFIWVNWPSEHRIEPPTPAIDAAAMSALKAQFDACVSGTDAPKDPCPPALIFNTYRDVRYSWLIDPTAPKTKRPALSYAASDGILTATGDWGMRATYVDDPGIGDPKPGSWSETGTFVARLRWVEQAFEILDISYSSTQ